VAGGTVIGMDTGIHDKADAHARLVRHPKIGFDIAHGIGHGAGGVAAAAEQVRDRDGVGGAIPNSSRRDLLSPSRPAPADES